MSGKFSQTQRNYMVEELQRVAGEKLIHKGEALTPNFFKEVGQLFFQRGYYDHQTVVSAFALSFKEDQYNQNANKISVQMNMKRGFEWAQKGVCSTRKEVRDDILKGATQLPTTWYEQQIEEGNYTIEPMNKVKRCDMQPSDDKELGQPEVKVIYPAEEGEQKKYRKKLVRRCNAAMDQLVDAYKEMHAYCHDVEKWMNASYRKLMLGDSDVADELLTAVLKDGKKL